MVDLDTLADFLISDRAPLGCMDLSELDGFMAGLIAGPEPVAPDVWLPMVWDDDEPEFADAAEAEHVLDTIGARYQEIAAGLDATPPDYMPVFWEDLAGTTITEDWSAGFMQAVALHPRSWGAVLSRDETAALLIPIAAIAGLALPAEAGGDLDVPDDVLDRMIAEGETLLPTCVVGLRLFWRARGIEPAPWPAVASRRRH
ncbi:MAG: UPF0149 family protein [Acetobacteraceae bacterium]